MRRRISDKNTFPAFSMENEYRKLHDLFVDRSEFGYLVSPMKAPKGRPDLSYNDCLQSIFLDWELRGTFTSLEEMLFGLQISEDEFEKECSEERLLDYIQFVLNAITFVSREVNKARYTIYQASDSIYKAIFDNSRLLLNKLGAEMVNMSNELVIIYKDDVATAVGIQNPDISVSISEYLKIDNRGDIQRKEEILCTFSKRLEAIETQLKGTEFNSLYTDTTMLLNKTGVRHTLDCKDKIEAKFAAMDENDIEKWYDRAFQMFLACLSVRPYLEFKSEVKAIKNC